MGVDKDIDIVAILVGSVFKISVLLYISLSIFALSIVIAEFLRAFQSSSSS